MTAVDDLRTHLKQREELLFRSETRHSPEALDTLLSREFQEIGRSGRFYNYSDTISALLNETPDGVASAEEFNIRMLAQTVALVTYRSVRKTQEGGTIETRRSSTWRLEDGDIWRMVFHQGTPI